MMVRVELHSNKRCIHGYGFWNGMFPPVNREDRQTCHKLVKENSQITFANYNEVHVMPVFKAI